MTGSDRFVEIAVIVVAVAIAVIIFQRWYYSRPRQFEDFDGNPYTWHPGGRFTDKTGRTVTDPERVKRLRQAWAHWNTPPNYPG